MEDMLQGAAFRVLACFYDKDTRNFVELCQKAGYPTDLGGYYIRQLISSGYLERVARGQHRITPKGKQQLALYYDKPLFGLQPRYVVVLVARQSGKYVVLRRSTQPFIGVAEWQASAIRPGEPVYDAAQRVLQTRLGVTADCRVVGLFRRIDMYKDTVFDDKVFVVNTCELPAGLRLAAEGPTGANSLYTAEELATLERPSKALLSIFRFIQGNGAYEEHVYHLDKTDLDGGHTS
jgi:predicted transcriptional regulator